MRVVKRQQVFEEGLCCLRVSGRIRSNNNTEVGSSRCCRCYRGDINLGEESGSGWSGYRRSVSRRNTCGGETAGGWGGPLLPPSEWEEQQQQEGWWLEELQVL